MLVPHSVKDPNVKRGVACSVINGYGLYCKRRHRKRNQQYREIRCDDTTLDKHQSNSGDWILVSIMVTVSVLDGLYHIGWGVSTRLYGISHWSISSHSIQSFRSKFPYHVQYSTARSFEGFLFVCRSCIEKYLPASQKFTAVFSKLSGKHYLITSWHCYIKITSQSPQQRIYFFKSPLPVPFYILIS